MEKIGDILKRERQRIGVTLEHISSVTKISLDVLQKIEKNEFQHLPARPYIRGFLLSIARILEIDPKVFLEPYDRAYLISRGATSVHPIESISDEKSDIDSDLGSKILGAANEVTKIFFSGEEEDLGSKRGLIDKKPIKKNTAKIRKLYFLVGAIFAAVFLLAIVVLFNVDFKRDSSSSIDSSSSTARPTGESAESQIIEDEPVVIDPKDLSVEATKSEGETSKTNTSAQSKEPLTKGGKLSEKRLDSISPETPQETKPSKPAATTGVLKPSVAPEIPKPSSATDKAKPAEASKPTETAKPTKPAEISKPEEAIKPVKPAVTPKPALDPKPLQPAVAPKTEEAAKPLKPAETAKPEKAEPEKIAPEPIVVDKNLISAPSLQPKKLGE